MKRVLFVDHVNRILGGAEINLLELLPLMRDRQRWMPGCACSPSSPLSKALDGLSLKHWPHEFSPALNETRFANRALPVLKLHGALKELDTAAEKLAGTVFPQFEPHVVVSCTNKDHFCSSRAAERRHIPSVWWINDIISGDFFPWAVRKYFHSEARKRATCLVVVSDYSRRQLIEGGFPAEKVKTVWNGVSLADFEAAERGIMRELCGLRPDQPVIGLVGRITQWKGHELFLQIARDWVESGRCGNFVIIGKAFNEDQEFESELRKYIDHHKLTDRVQFIPFQTNVAAVLRDLDVLLHTSLRPEPFGRVIIEAMAAGTPVVAARGGGVPEIITHDRDGLLAQPGDAQDYSACLQRLLAGDELASNLKAAARETVRSKFTLQHMQDRFESVLEELK